MISALASHLWQSTWFAGAAALLALVLRGNRPRVRYWIWLSASAKFLVPFAVLVGITFEPRQLAPGPSHQVKMSSRPRSQRSYGGIDCVASSRISEVSASMSYASKAAT